MLLKKKKTTENVPFFVPYLIGLVTGYMFDKKPQGSLTHMAYIKIMNHRKRGFAAGGRVI